MLNAAIAELEVVAVGEELGVALPPEVLERLDPSGVGEIAVSLTDAGAVLLTPLQAD